MMKYCRNLERSMCLRTKVLMIVRKNPKLTILGVGGPEIRKLLVLMEFFLVFLTQNANIFFS